jgi:uncharacterized protein (DUF169 family)
MPSGSSPTSATCGIPLIPVLAQRHRHIVYAPLAATPLPPDAVLLFVGAAQTLVLVEAAEGVDGGRPPAMGRPACALIPQVVNQRAAALSLGCCGARAYLDMLADDVAIFALPGARLAECATRIVELAKANSVLAAFHRLRRRDVEAGREPDREAVAGAALRPLSHLPRPALGCRPSTRRVGKY